jgi:hypothetical protein
MLIGEAVVARIPLSPRDHLTTLDYGIHAKSAALPVSPDRTMARQTRMAS